MTPQGIKTPTNPQIYSTLYLRNYKDVYVFKKKLNHFHSLKRHVPELKI